MRIRRTKEAHRTLHTGINEKNVSKCITAGVRRDCVFSFSHAKTVFVFFICMIQCYTNSEWVGRTRWELQETTIPMEKQKSSDKKPFPSNSIVLVCEVETEVGWHKSHFIRFKILIPTVAHTSMYECRCIECRDKMEKLKQYFKSMLFAFGICMCSNIVESTLILKFAHVAWTTFY